jgi:C4-dicarboxylate-specific signal transduction histidine kinase
MAMADGGWLCGEASCEEGVKRIGIALHDLCQPLTTLQCRLEMATLIGTAEAYREAAELGLTECARLAEAVGSIREIVRAATREGAGDGAGKVGVEGAVRR